MKRQRTIKHNKRNKNKQTHRLMITTTVIVCSGYLAGSVFHRQGPRYWASTCQQKPILELLEDVRPLDVTLTQSY